jgi:4-amino-4-deoxy-L-arabinose transferase-like glycosyltransferase
MTDPNPSPPAPIAPDSKLLSRLRTLLFLLALLLAGGTSLVNPLFEAPDERLHYQFVRYLLDEGALPLQPQDDTLTQYHQPPLYYALGALFVAPVEDTGIEPLPNPFWLTYEPGELHRDNKAQFLPQSAYAFPYYSTALGVHLLRVWSLLLVAGTLLLFLGIARQLWPNDPQRQLLLFALAGLNPMFLYIGSSANNDNMVVFLATALLWLVIRGVQEGFTLQLALLTGLVWGLAGLSKITGLFLIAPWAAGLAWDGWRRRAWRNTLLYAVVISAVALLLGGWWYLRNIRLYGELFGMERMLDIWGERVPGEMDWPTLLSTARYALDTFWGRFGYGQIVLPPLFYLLFALLTLAGIWGLLRGMRLLWRFLSRGPAEDGAGVWLVLLATAGVYLPALFYFIWRNPSGANGRYTFPALVAFAAFIVLGLTSLPLHRYLSAVVTLFMVAAALVSLAWLVPWTYATPPQRAELPTLDASGELVWEPGMRLLGTRLDERDLSGQEEPQLALTACWRGDEPPAQNYVFYVHVVDQAFNVLGARDTHTGLGNYPTSLWQAGDTFCEYIRVPLRNGPQPVQVADVIAGFYDPETDEPLQAYDASGAPLELVVVDRIKVGQPQQATDPTETLAAFDQGLGLQRYEWSAETVAPGETVTLQAWWRASGPTIESYTIFAHLSGSDAELLAQDDQLPQEGRYPTTFWGADEVIRDTYTFSIPQQASTGPTTLSLGFYRLSDNSRLARQDTTSPLDAVIIPGPTIAHE